MDSDTPDTQETPASTTAPTPSVPAGAAVRTAAPEPARQTADHGALNGRKLGRMP
jgi:hypothetical protein